MTEKSKNDWDIAHNHKPYILEETVTFGEHHKQMLDAMKAPRELSDKEILEIADLPELCNDDGSIRSCINFARAILKKASEK